MGMDVNNSRLSGMDPNEQSESAQIRQARQAQNKDKYKNSQEMGENPSPDDVDTFQSLLNDPEKKAETKQFSAEKGLEGKFGTQQQGTDQNVSAQKAQHADSAYHTDKLKSEHKGKPEAGDVESSDQSMRKHSEKSTETKMPSAESLFAGMFGTQQPQGAGQVAQEGQAAPLGNPDALDSMVTNMVDRILVSDPGKGQQEVRLTFSDAALKGTEVTLLRSLDGQLTVKLNTTDPASFQTLVGAQGSLREALERNGQNVRVEANLNTGQEENDANQRSSTYQEYKEDEA